MTLDNQSLPIRDPAEDPAVLVRQQRAFFEAGNTMDFAFRRRQLRLLYKAVTSHEERLMEALEADMGKPRVEAFAGEIGFVKKEIRHALRHLRSWMRPRRMPTSMAHWPARSWVQSRPRGVVLILAPWNYPFNLLLTPLIGAMAAGNCAVLKPSEHAPATTGVVRDMLGECFGREYVAVLEMPGYEVTGRLLQPCSFDHVFYTGGVVAGKSVYKTCAEKLTPVTLELGGKSPALVLDDADLRLAARRIAQGKFFNAGQTCVAPDYALVPEASEGPFLEALAEAIRAFYGEKPLESPDMARLIHRGSFDRLAALLDGAEVLVGGVSDRDSLRMEPTVVRVSEGHPLMQEEIFGPILPLFTYRREAEAEAFIRQHPEPLAFYLFTSDRRRERDWLNRVPFGGGAVNATLIQVASTQLPFGGVGSSGLGKYHGKYSYDLFSHEQGITRSAAWPDLALRYPPYSSFHEKIARWLYG